MATDPGLLDRREGNDGIPVVMEAEGEQRLTCTLSGTLSDSLVKLRGL